MGLLDSTATTQNAPWKPAQPFVKFGMQQAKRLYNSGAGFKAPNFQTWTPMSAQTKGALGTMSGLAAGPNQLAGQSMGALSGILEGDINGKYNDLYAQSDNPHYEAATQIGADKIANDVQRQFSGLGRVGSAADTGALVDQIGNWREQALNNHWDQNIANQRGILGDQSQARLGAVAAAPGAYDSQFAPARIQAQVGSAYDDLRTRQIQSRLDKFNTGQQAGWNRLGAYQGALAGGGPQGTGQQTVTQPFNWAGALTGGALAGASIAKTLSGL